MHRLIYISRSLVGADTDQIDAIVSSSVRWNEAVDVTGMLWADGTSFAQVIEGSAASIALTMERIRADRRHTDIMVLLDRQVQSRQFAEWSMRWAGSTDATVHGTAFMMGFALSERTSAAQRLREIVLACDDLGA